MKLPVVSAQTLCKLLIGIGCIEKRQSGSHRIFNYPKQQRLIIVPMHKGDLKRGLLRGIIKDLDITVKEFVALLRRK